MTTTGGEVKRPVEVENADSTSDETQELLDEEYHFGIEPIKTPTQIMDTFASNSSQSSNNNQLNVKKVCFVLVLLLLQLHIAVAFDN